MITAMDKAGDTHSYLLKHQSGDWKSASTVNDIKGSAPEGLMALTADKDDNFYAVWLDTRLAQKNNIFLSKVNGSGKWSKNKLVYQSPEGHVCECCKPASRLAGKWQYYGDELKNQYNERPGKRKFTKAICYK